MRQGVYAFTRPGDAAAQSSAREVGAVRAGASTEAAPVPLDAALILAPVGALVPVALRALPGRLGRHPHERHPELPLRRSLGGAAGQVRRQPHPRHGDEFLPLAAEAGIRTETRPYPLEQANAALEDLLAGRLQGAAVP